MDSGFALRVVGILVLMPTTLVAGFWTLLAVPALADAMSEPSVAYPWRVLWWATLLLAGWFGLVTTWRLYYRFESGDDVDNTAWHWAGLAAGCATSAALLVTIPGQYLAAWPLIGAAYFGWRLQARRAFTR